MYTVLNSSAFHLAVDRIISPDGDRDKGWDRDPEILRPPEPTPLWPQHRSSPRKALRSPQGATARAVGKAASCSEKLQNTGQYGVSKG